MLKKKEENNLNIINLQSKIKQEHIKNLENQLDKQNIKDENLKKGLNVSKTDSQIEYDLNSNMKIENGVAYLSYIFENHLILLKLDFFQILFELKSKKKKKQENFFKKNTFNNIINYENNLKNSLRKKRQSEFISPIDMELQEKKLEKRHNYNNLRLSFGKNKKKEEKTKKKNIMKIDILPIEEVMSEENLQSNKFIQIANLNEDYKPVDKSQLVEYDLFYKEQFFKNDVFKYDVNEIEDKEEKEINREMHKLDVKRRLIAKKKEKEVNLLKGLSTEDLEIEIEELEKEYKKVKTKEKPKVDMIMNNTEGLLHKGRMLESYFIGKKNADFPRFALENEKEIGAKEVIDFKNLRKEEQARRYFDYCICLKQRKQIHKCLVYIRYWFSFFLGNWVFDNMSLLAIIANTIIILASDPTDPNNLGNKVDPFFLYFYTFEAALKIVSYTFYSAEDAYIKDYWNIFDFIVVIVGWISWVLERLFKGTNMRGLAGLRAFRILRPLRALKSIKGLKKLASALIASIVHLGETTIILFFVFLIFALAGNQMWQGNFFKRCMNVNYGYMSSIQGSEYMCSFDSDCEELNSYGVRYICAKGYINPDSGVISFDNILTGFVTIFVMASLEGWTNVFTYASKTFKDKIYINPIIIFFYFHFFIFFCSFYLINLFLAVTNSEFEHIESERKLLIEKKSFYQLIKDKYDLREKEKISKKEKERKLKETNIKKSDQSLQDLYRKIKQEAFSISKNKRSIPVLYSTVKDMYIMSNNNPEELYLQSLRFSKEDKFLSKDISRRQDEINKLIKEKREELKKIQSQRDKTLEAKLSKSNTTNSINNFYRLHNNNNINPHNNNFQHLNNNNIHTVKRTFSSLKKNIKINENKFLIEELKKLVNKINKELIKDSIDRTQKNIKEKTINISKKIHKVGQEDKDRSELRKKLEKKGKKKLEFYQIIMEEDLPYEKDIRKIKEQKKGNESKIKYQNQMNKAMKVEKEIRKENKEMITDALSFMSELSLSSEEKGLCRSKIIGKEEKSDKELISLSNSIISKSDILFCDEKEIGSDDKIFNQKINFYRPSSILDSIIKYKNNKEAEKKLKKMQNNFNIRTFLRKEKQKGTNLSKIGKRNSFLRFLKYTQEPKNLDDFFISAQRRGSLLNNLDFIYNNDIDDEQNMASDNNDFNDEMSLLSSDSYLSNKDNLSITEIDLCQKEIKDDKIMIISSKESENMQKLLNSNKLIKNIRDSVFDRTAINKNIELTTEQQSKFLGLINMNFNKNLYPDQQEPRGRKKDDLDVSHVAEYKNYEEFLQEPIPLNINEHFNENDIKEKKEEAKEKEEINGKSRIQSSNYIISIKEASKRRKKKGYTSRNLKNIGNNFNETTSDYDNSNFNLGIKSSRTKIFNKPSNIFDKSTINISSISHNTHADTVEKKLKSNKKGGYYIFKAKSIEKNINKYPKQDTNQFLVKEENKPYKDPLTIQQEAIPDNLRGKKYYLNYLYNISDKDLKVKDAFKVDRWSDEILGIKKQYIKKKPLPESTLAFFVFNDKKLNLKRYKYFHHKDLEYKDEECSYLTHHLKYLPRTILETMPVRIRNFGKFADGKVVKLGPLGNKSTILSNEFIQNKSQIKSFDPRSGKAFASSLRNKSTIVTNSSFANHYKVQEEVKYRKNLFERGYKKLDELNYRTLSTYFTEEEKFFSKLLDEKRNLEKIRELEIYNNEKENRLEVKGEIMNIEIYDLKTNSRRYVQWSGPDVLKSKNEDENRKKWNNLINALENFNVIIWSSNCSRYCCGEFIFYGIRW